MEYWVCICPAITGGGWAREGEEKHPAEPGLLVNKREEDEGQGMGRTSGRGRVRIYS